MSKLVVILKRLEMTFGVEPDLWLKFGCRKYITHLYRRFVHKFVCGMGSACANGPGPHITFMYNPRWKKVTCYWRDTNGPVYFGAIMGGDRVRFVTLFKLRFGKYFRCGPGLAFEYKHASDITFVKNGRWKVFTGRRTDTHSSRTYFYVFCPQRSQTSAQKAITKP